MRLFSLLFIILALHNPTGASAAPEISDEHRAHRAAAQLIRSQLPSGFFPYDFNFATGEESDMESISGENLVRQSGAAFGLSEYLLGQDSQEVRAALAKFLSQSADRSLPISRGWLQAILEGIGLYNRWQLWETLRTPLNELGLLYSPDGNARLVAVHDSYELALPGATAFTLLAALNYRQATGDRQFDDEILAWREGLRVLKVPRRGFREAPHYLSESTYANGESWLAFATYARAFPEDESTTRLVQELDSYMMAKYGDEHNPRFYHWGTMAAAVRWETTQDTRFYNFLHKLTQSMLQRVGASFPKANSCASIEGLATYLAAMKDSPPDTKLQRAGAREFIYRAMWANRKLQLDENSAVDLDIDQQYRPQLQAYSGAFVRSPKEPIMQVDYTQHCLSALLRMEAAGVAR